MICLFSTRWMSVACRLRLPGKTIVVHANTKKQQNYSGRGSNSWPRACEARVITNYTTRASRDEACVCVSKSKIETQPKGSMAGNWTPVSCVTGRNTNHYTTTDVHTHTHLEKTIQDHTEQTKADSTRGPPNFQHIWPHFVASTPPQGMPKHPDRAQSVYVWLYRLYMPRFKVDQK